MESQRRESTLTSVLVEELVHQNLSPFPHFVFRLNGYAVASCAREATMLSAPRHNVLSVAAQSSQPCGVSGTCASQPWAQSSTNIWFQTDNHTASPKNVAQIRLVRRHRAQTRAEKTWIWSARLLPSKQSKLPKCRKYSLLCDDTQAFPHWFSKALCYISSHVVC